MEVLEAMSLTLKEDLVLERTDTRWLMKVVAKDSVKGILIGDPVVTALDEFAQRI